MSCAKMSLFLLWLVLSVILTGRPSSGFQTGFITSLQQRSSFDRILNCSSKVFSPLRATPPNAASADSSSDLLTSPLPGVQSKKEKRILLVWLHTVSIFVVGNYIGKTLWPAFLFLIPVKVWNLIHALSAMLFAGGVVTTTLLEWNLPSIISATAGNAKKDQEQPDGQSSTMLLTWLWQVESRLVIPAVTMSLISGVAQSYHYYNTLRFAPTHVKSSLHVMFLFGIWWAWTDRRSQASIRKHGFDVSRVVQRQMSNLVSCAFLVALYSIMILKPGA
jgi:hypothetical protein